MVLLSAAHVDSRIHSIDRIAQITTEYIYIDTYLQLQVFVLDLAYLHKLEMS